MTVSDVLRALLSACRATDRPDDAKRRWAFFQHAHQGQTPLHTWHAASECRCCRTCARSDRSCCGDVDR